MKKLSLILISLFISGVALAEYQFETPRPLNPPMPVSVVGIESYVAATILEYEIHNGPIADNFEVYAGQGEKCTQTAVQISCHFDYINDWYHGTADLVFKVQDNMITELSNIEFGGFF